MCTDLIKETRYRNEKFCDGIRRVESTTQQPAGKNSESGAPVTITIPVTQSVVLGQRGLRYEPLGLHSGYDCSRFLSFLYSQK